ncbi:Protein of unknown function [Pyronema omphalodes CBS 100304]|uniref:Uncharacterized protein n=1 Tax=Pyronema omphalodes (strain CBS 100304) TaxID=1076935 RepID=U4LW24_PYROM|nr:Protein of unknown function [Pyronema omphalodes CBS 100304]
MLSAARPRLVAIKATRPFSSTSYVVNKLERDDIANMVDRPYLTDAPVIVYPKVHSSVYKKAGWINHRPIPSNDRRSTDKRTFATLPSSIPKPTLQYSDPPIFPRLWTPPAETPIRVPHLQKYIPRVAAVVRPSIYPTERHHSEPPVLPKLHARPIEREIRVPFLFTYVGTGKTRPAVNTTVEGSNAVSAGTFGVNVKELVKPRFYSTMRPTSANASANAWAPAVLPKLHIMEPEKIVRVPLLPENVYAKYHRHEFVEKVMEPKRLAVLVVGADGDTSEVEEVALRERFGVDVRELIMTDEKEQEDGERDCTIRPREDDMGDQMTEEKRMWMKFLGLVAAVWYASGWGGC